MRLRVEQVRRLLKDRPATKRYPVSVADGRATRCAYSVGETYVAQVEAAGKAKARVTVTGRRRARLGELSQEDIEAEGFSTRAGFAAAWLREHEQWPPTRWAWCPSCPKDGTCAVCEGLGAIRRPVEVPDEETLSRFEKRHAHRQVWVLDLVHERQQPVVWLAPAGQPAGSEHGYTSRMDLGMVDAGEVLDDAAVAAYVEQARVEHRQSRNGRRSSARDIGRRARQAVLHADPDAPQLAVIEQAVAELEEGQAA